VQQASKPVAQPQKLQGGASWLRMGSLLTIIGGVLIIANFAMSLLGMKDILQMVYGDMSVVSLAPELLQVISITAGAGCLLSGIIIKLKPFLDLYFGIVVALLGLGSIMSGNGYIIGGVVAIIGGFFAIIGK
jgi:hypothetical protein